MVKRADYGPLGEVMDRIAWKKRRIRGPYNVARYIREVTGGGPSGPSFSAYYHDKSTPNPETMRRFCEAFDCTRAEENELAYARTFRLEGAPMNEITERDTLLALMVRTPDEPGMLHALTRVILEHRANITYVDIADRREGDSTIYFELEDVAAPEVLISDLDALPIVRMVERAPSFAKVYGKRIIVIGGGAQVGQVVVGAVAEADRHNIRGERISVDTIPLVGEENLASAVRAVARLPRAVALVLAGALMGGDVARAVREIRDKGIIVLSLNMPGSVPDAADLVVSDPVQAGVMAVMAISSSARFDIRRHRGRRY